MNFSVALPWFIAFTIAFHVAAQELQDNYCLAEDDTPYLNFATKTAYEVIKAKKSFQSVPNCDEVALWMLSRHAARYPDEKEIKKLRELTYMRDNIVDNHEVRHNGELCLEDLEALKNWKYEFRPQMANQLNHLTEEEAKLLGMRYATALPQVFRNSISYPSDLLVGTTSLVRTIDTAKNFILGLKKIEPNLSPINSHESYPLLMPYFNCSVWDERSESDEAKVEMMAYQQSSESKKMVHEVSNRLGFKYDLTFAAIQDVYNLCRYEKALYYHNTSPWCAAFTKDHLQILEYHEDLKYYYSSGYGNELTSKLGCPLVQDLMERFENITKTNSSENERTSVLYFAHSVTLRSVITRLGMAWDPEAPKSSNRKLMENRQWKTSQLSPFMGNIAVILFRCTHGEEYKVMFYLNEHMVDYKGCDVGLCNWTYIYDRFQHVIDPQTCNLDFCHGTSSTINYRPNYSFILMTFLCLVKIMRVF